MSNQTWKQYGGVNKPDTYQYLTVGTLVAEQILIRNVFTVYGQIIVQQSADVSLNVNVGRDVNAYGNINAYGNLISYQNAFVQSDIYTSNVYINNKLYFGTANNGTTVFPDTSGTYSYIYGNSINGTFGINTTNPQYLLDINGTNSLTNPGQIFSIRTDASSIHNVFARTSQDSGITVDSDTKTTSIGFYSGNTITSGIPNATIQSISGGNMLLNGSNIEIGSHLVVSQTGIFDTISGEPVTIYGNPINPYMSDYFNNSSIRSGKALTLVTTDNSSSTFLNILTPNQTGISIGGGALMGNTSKSFGTLGFNNVKDTSIQTQSAYTNNNIVYQNTSYENIYIPSQTMVHGNNNIKNKSTLGINTYYPKTNEYVLDVNGPMRIGDGELTSILHTQYQILFMKCAKFNPQTAISVGTATLLDRLVDTGNNYSQNISFTQDGGRTWNTIPIGYKTIDVAQPQNLCITVFDASYAFIGSNTTTLFYTYNGGLNWQQITNKNSLTSIIYNFTSIYNYRFSSFFRIVLGGINVNINNISQSTPSIFYIDIPTNSTSQISGSYTNITSALSSIVECDGFSSIVCFVGRGIQVYDVSNNTSLLVYNTTKNYNSVYVYNANFAVAVGTNIISCSTNGLTNWTDISINHINEGQFNLRNIYIYDRFNALAVGDNGVFLYTKNGSLTWQFIPENIINTSGIGKCITENSNQLTSIFMPNANSFVISKTLSTFSDNSFNAISSNNVAGKSNILYGYFPSLFNRANNNVLDISGNMVISGDINVDIGNVKVAGVIQGNSILTIGSDSFLNSRLFVGGDTSLNGNIFVFQNTFQQGDVAMNSRLFVNSDVSLNSKLFVKSDVSMNSRLFVGADVSLNSNLYVRKNTIQQGDVQMQNKLFVLSDVTMNGKLMVNSDTSMNSRLFVGSDVSFANNLYIGGVTTLNSGLSMNGDTSLNGNVYVGSKTIQQGDVTMNSRLFVNSDTSLNGNVYITSKTFNQGDVTMNSRLFVIGDISTNGNLNVLLNTIQQGDVKMNSRLFVQSDVSFNGKLFVNSDVITKSSLIVGTDTSLNGNVYVGSNTYQQGNVIMNSNLLVNQNATIGGSLNCISDINITGNVYTNNAIYSNNYDSTINGNTIFIGNQQNNRTINIGFGGNLGSKNIINIGNPNDIIHIYGTTMSTTSSVTSQKTMILNADNSNNKLSYGSGILIYDNCNNYAGYNILSDDMTGFLLKTTQSNNIVRLDIKSMMLPSVTENGPPNASILMVVPSIDSQSNYTVTTNNSFYLDANNSFHSTNKSIFHNDINDYGNLYVLGNTSLKNTVIQSIDNSPALQLNGIMVSNNPIFQF